MNTHTDNLIALNLNELRTLWSELWGKKPHSGIYRNLLEKSILFKKGQLDGKWLNSEDQIHLKNLISQYKRDPALLTQKKNDLSSGTKLVRIWQGNKYIVIVKENGFEYDGKIYFSLSKVAFIITGTKWNGWLFFGLKNKDKAK
jgi:hypothetical protein